jgi:hypothetical protein
LGASLYPNTDEEIIENINPEILDEKKFLKVKSNL